MTKFSFSCTPAVIVCLALAIAGCNSGVPEPELYAVSGDVLLDGKPMESGEVTFVSVADGIRDTLKVNGGKFAGNVQAGERKIEIRSYKPQNEDGGMYAASAAMGEPSMINVVDAKYNRESDISATVSTSGENTYSFEAKSG